MRIKFKPEIIEPKAVFRPKLDLRLMKKELLKCIYCGAEGFTICNQCRLKGK